MRRDRFLYTHVAYVAWQVVPVFAGGLDFSLPVRKYFYDPLGSGKAFVDCVVSLTGFALVGGPARQDAPKVPVSPTPS